jgi:hypothetical protein
MLLVAPLFNSLNYNNGYLLVSCMEVSLVELESPNIGSLSNDLVQKE